MRSELELQLDPSSCGSSESNTDKNNEVCDVKDVENSNILVGKARYNRKRSSSKSVDFSCDDFVILCKKKRVDVSPAKTSDAGVTPTKDSQSGMFLDPSGDKVIDIYMIQVKFFQVGHL